MNTQALLYLLAYALEITVFYYAFYYLLKTLFKSWEHDLLQWVAFAGAMVVSILIVDEVMVWVRNGLSLWRW